MQDGLAGRRDEQAAIGQLLADAAAGRGGALAFGGQPGIGKTALLEWAAAGGATRVVWLRGDHSPLALPAGVLDLLRELARERPVLCCVDDAQWLDEPSWLVVTFVAKRLRGSRIALLLASTEDTGPDRPVEGVPARRVGPLDRDASLALLAELVPPGDVAGTLAGAAGAGGRRHGRAGARPAGQRDGQPGRAAAGPGERAGQPGHRPPRRAGHAGRERR